MRPPFWPVPVALPFLATAQQHYAGECSTFIKSLGGAFVMPDFTQNSPFTHLESQCKQCACVCICPF